MGKKDDLDEDRGVAAEGDLSRQIRAGQLDPDARKQSVRTSTVSTQQHTQRREEFDLGAMVKAIGGVYADGASSSRASFDSLAQAQSKAIEAREKLIESMRAQIDKLIEKNEKLTERIADLSGKDREFRTKELENTLSEKKLEEQHTTYRYAMDKLGPVLPLLGPVVAGAFGRFAPGLLPAAGETGSGDASSGAVCATCTAADDPNRAAFVRVLRRLLQEQSEEAEAMRGAFEAFAGPDDWSRVVGFLMTEALREAQREEARKQAAEAKAAEASAADAAGAAS